jgi:hypothetical protein
MSHDRHDDIPGGPSTVVALRVSPSTVKRADVLIARLGALGLGDEHTRSTLLRLALRYGLAEIDDRLRELETLGGQRDET